LKDVNGVSETGLLYCESSEVPSEFQVLNGEFQGRVA